jgi:molybdenum cofactor guanylyltransferase
MSIGGIILAGGRSSRMGLPKAGLPFGSETLLQRVHRSLESVVSPTVIALGRDQDRPDIPGARFTHDEFPAGGPLAGLLSGLEWLSSRGIDAGFVASCDMPFLSPTVIREIARQWRNADVAAVRLDGRWQPMAAIYATSLVPIIRQRLAAGDSSLQGLIEASRHYEIDAASVFAADPDRLAFVNVNTPDQYSAALEALRRQQTMPPPDGITLRAATTDDAEAISQLVTESAVRFITPQYSATGAAVLLEGMTADQTRERMALGFRYIVAVEDNRIVGVAAIKDNSHLYHLFVAEPFHRRGIATRLWQQIKEEAMASGNPGRITVNSSSFAVPFYLKLGFVKDGGLTAKNEITCQPMIWQLAHGLSPEPAEDRQI